jgi:tetratricopeptide (TPR) repeat protein
VTPTLFI